MASRELPTRRARSAAIRELQGYDEAAIHFDHIGEDDVANFAEDRADDMDLSDEVQVVDDETAENAEEWAIHFEEASASSDDEDSAFSLLTDSYHSRDGTEWRTNTSEQGRRPARNILEERAGFPPHIRPTTFADGFYVVFDEILDSAVLYTNLYGRRLARDRNFEWKRTDRTELNAFIGLHILAGELSTDNIFISWCSVYRAL